MTVCATLVTTLAACGGGAGEAGTAPGEPFSVVLSGYPALPESVPWIVGEEKGFFAAEGANIKDFVGGSGGGASLRNLLATDAPLASVATSAAVQSFSEGVPLVAVAGSGNNLATNLLVASRDSGITSVSDLAKGTGWKFGFTNPNSTTETVVEQAIETWKLQDAGVEKVSAGGTGEGIALLAAGDLDVFTVPISAYQGSESQFGPVLANGADLAPAYTWSMLVSTPDLLAARSEEINGVLRGLATAVDYVKANPEEAAAMWAKEAQIDGTVARETVTLMIDSDALSKGAVSDAGWSVATTVLADQGLGDVDLSSFFDPRVLDAVGQSYPQALR